MRLLPLLVAHPIHLLARRIVADWLPGASRAGVVPLGETVTTESREDHHLDVLHVRAHLEVLHELLEGVGCGRLIERHVKKCEKGVILIVIQ